jgi:hypothetical protein
LTNVVVRAYYDKALSPRLEDLFNSLADLEMKGAVIERIERSSLSEEKESALIDEIRKIKPQLRGSVVTSGRNMLPLSRSKKLNFLNTPIVLVGKENEGNVYVFPCAIGEEYYNISKGLSFVKAHLAELPELPGISEESITKRIVDDPSMLEEGLRWIGEEEKVSTGVCDIVFEDKSGKILLVEVERELSDQAIGQVLRLAAGYEKDHNTTVRAAIVCLRRENLGAKRAGIEVWVLEGFKTRKL